MAQGDIVVFSAAKLNMGDGNFALSTGPWLAMIIKTAASDPTENDSDPGYNAGRTQNWIDDEVTPGGNYAVGGTVVDAIITDNWTLSGNVCKFDVDNVTWSQHASNPADAEFVNIYQNDGNDYGLLFLDIGGAFNMTTGDLAITWNSGGLFTVT